MADRESPHDANALALSPTNRTMHPATLKKFGVWDDFIVVLLLKVDGDSGNREANLDRYIAPRRIVRFTVRHLSPKGTNSTMETGSPLKHFRNTA